MFDGIELIFSVPAVLGTVIFLFKIAGTLLGAGDLGGDADVGFDPAAAGDPGAGLEVADDLSGRAAALLSLQSIAALLMGAGWAGLICQVTFGWELWVSGLVAIAGGLGMVWFVATLFRAMFRLQSSGNVSIHDAVGTEGTVVVSIPEGNRGSGRVRVVMGNRQREVNAVSVGESGVAMGASVRVVGVTPERALRVEPING